MKNKIYMTICSMAFLLASCQQETFENETEKLMMSLEANIGYSQSFPTGRYVGDTPNDVAFGNGDKIGLSVDGGNFVKWTYADSKWSPTGNPVYWADKTKNYVFRAFYPYNEGAGLTLNNVPMPNLSEQVGSMESIASRDFLVASKTQSYGSDGVVSFTEDEGAPFEHISSLVKIVIKGNGDLASATITGISIQGTNIVTSTSYSFDNNGAVELDDASINELYVQNLERAMDGSDQTFYFILNSGTVELDDMSMVIEYTSGTKNYKAKLEGLGDDGVRLASGKLYAYTLNVYDGKLVVTGNDIKDWESGASMDDIVINGEEQA